MNTGLLCFLPLRNSPKKAVDKVTFVMYINARRQNKYVCNLSSFFEDKKVEEEGENRDAQANTVTIYED